jgi:uncharacterized protein (TIGR03000 family)
MYSLVLLTLMSSTAPAPGCWYYGYYGYGGCYGYCYPVYCYPVYSYPYPVVRPGPTSTTLRPNASRPKIATPPVTEDDRPKVVVPPPPDVVPPKVIAPFQERDGDALKKIEMKEEAPKKIEKKDDAEAPKKIEKKDDADAPKKIDKKDDADAPKKIEKKDDEDAPKKNDKKDDADAPKKIDKPDEKGAAAPPRSRSVEGPSASATLVVRLPASARLYVNEALCPMTSGTRTIRTPRLEAGRNYTYTLKTEVVSNGRTRVETRTVNFQAGSQVTVDFGAAPISTAQR